MPKRKKKSQNLIKIKEPLIVLSAAIISFILWDSFIIYPVKLFVVIWHEISHGIAAIFTSGRVHEIVFSYDLGGQCITEDGIPFIVASSGYLGSLLIGAVLFRTSYDRKASKWVCTGLAVLLILFTANFVNVFGGAIVALLFSALLFVSPRYFPQELHNYLWRILGIISCTYVFIDLKQDIFSEGFISNDAHIISEITGLSSGFWGILWILISLAVIAHLIHYSYKRSST